MQFPAGLLVDRLGVRRVISMSLATSSLGSLLFAFAPNIFVLCLGRAIVALGDAVVFSCLIKFVALNFRNNRFGLMSGLSQLFGYLGGVLATSPLAIAVGSIGWRSSFAILGLLSIANFFASLFVLDAKPTPIAPVNTWQLIRRTLLSLPGWGVGLIYATYFASITSFSGVWGIPLLMQRYGLARTEAGSVMLLFMIGTAAGSLVAGYLVDLFHHPKAMVVISCVMRASLFLSIAPTATGGNWSAFQSLEVLALGFIGGGTVPLLLKMMRGIHGIDAIGSGSSLNATFGGLLATLVQPLLGTLLDSHLTLTDAGFGSAGPYDMLLLLLAVLSISGLVGLALIKKTG